MSTHEVVLIGLIVLGVVAIAVSAMFFERSVRLRQRIDGVSLDITPQKPNPRGKKPPGNLPPPAPGV